MRRTSLIGLALALGLVVSPAAPARGADLRVGYIDSARIFIEYKDALESQQRFDRLVQGWRDEATEKEKAVTQLREEVRDQAPILSALKRQEKEAALQRAISEYDAFLTDIWGPSGKAQQENDRATTDIVTKVRAAVDKIASQKGLQLVLDAASGYLIYADRTLDLTTDVLTELSQSSTSTTH